MVRSLELLQREIQNCRLCSSYFGFEPHPLVWGNENARIMLVGQAPSRSGHLTGRPWNDQSGQKLRKWFGITEADFYNPDFFYLTALAHCFPGKDGRGNDRQPPSICASTWMSSEISQVRNLLYLLVGRRAAAYFLPKGDFTEQVFTEHALNGKPAFVLPHPSPANIKWYKDHPAFLTERAPQIRFSVQQTLGLENAGQTPLVL